MVIRGGTRGNGKQLAQYLVTLRDNESIQILEVAGRTGTAATSEFLDDVIIGMDLVSELTKSDKGMYHAQINPAIGEDKNMDWLLAADMLGKELGFENQRRVIVLHEKKGRTHAHVVWERYDHETGIMKSDSFSRLAQDRARQRMEIAFGHKQTPRRNQHRPELKASLLQLWNQTGTGAQFLAACKNNNYMLAQGSGRSQFIVVDERGHSFDLVRQLKGVRLKDVRYRMRNESLMTEKAAITYMRNLKSDRDTDGEGKQKTKLTRTAKQVAQEFAQTAAENTRRQEPHNKPSITKDFAESKQDKTLTELERIRQSFNKEREENGNRQQDRDLGLEY